MHVFRKKHRLNTNGEVIDVMAIVWNSSLEVSEFELQSRYYVHIWTNTFGKGMKPVIPTQAMG